MGRRPLGGLPVRRGRADQVASGRAAGRGLAQGGPLTSQEITAGLKEALSQGASLAMADLGAKGGYSADSLLRIRSRLESS